MVKVSYDVLAMLLYGLGMLLLVKLPQHDQTVGEQFFKAYDLPIWSNEVTSSGISFVWVFAALLQLAGILMYAKWIKQEHPEYIQKYRKLQPFLLAISLLVVPLLVNKMMDVGTKTWYYAGKKGVDAIEYVQEDSVCKYTKKDQQVVGECSIKLKNYDHKTQAFSMTVYPNSNETDPLLHYKVPDPIYLHRHESKNIQFQVNLGNKINVTKSFIEDHPHIQLVAMR